MGRPTGRPPKPTEQKRRIGNPGKRGLPEPAEVIPLRPAGDTPEPIRPLGRVGRSLWERVWAGGARWISPDTDVDLLQIVCEQLDERASLRVRVMSTNDWRERAALRQLDSAVLSGLSLLGFTPADRSRLGVAEVRAQSTLERLRHDNAR